MPANPKLSSEVQPGTKNFALFVYAVKFKKYRLYLQLYSSCCSLNAALSLLSADWTHCSILTSRWLMLDEFPILRCSPLANPRSLLADYCSLFAGRCWFLASCWSLLTTRCSLPHICEVGKKKGRPTRQLKILRKSKKQKSRPNVGNYKKKRCPLIKWKKSRSFVGKFKKIKENGL